MGVAVLKSLLMLANAPGRLKEVTQSLKLKGWDLRSHTELKSFLVDVTRLQPGYALISVEFKHPNMTQIRHLLEKVYRVTLIDFAEEQNLETRSKLRDMDSLHKIYGSLNGPAFERLIARISMDNGFSNMDRSISDERLGRGIKAVLNTVFKADDSSLRSHLTWVSHLHCLEVSAPGFRGHFLIAVANDRKLRGDVLNELSSGIGRLLDALGFDLEAMDMYDIAIRKVDFGDWASKAARIFERSVHEGLEIGIAFFPIEADEAKTVVDQFSNRGMVTIGVDELQPDLPLPFDVYIHLPLNDRFILYLPRAGTMSTHQQMALQSKGMMVVYTKDNEEEALKGYRTARRFDRSIAAYYENRSDQAA